MDHIRSCGPSNGNCRVVPPQARIEADAVDAVDLVNHVAIVLECQEAVGDAGWNEECARSRGVQFKAAPAREGRTVLANVHRHIENAPARAANQLGFRLGV